MAVYSSGKRAKKRKLNKGKIVACMAAVVLILAIIVLIIQVFAKQDTSDTNTDSNQQSNNIGSIVQVNEVEEKPQEKDPIADLKIPDKIGGYNVIGQLVIDKIKVNMSIIGVYSEAATKLTLTHFTGASINKPGNFCIIGHNYEGMLKNLSKLEVGDKFYLVDKATRTKVDYIVTKMTTCDPYDLSAFKQNKDGRREVTIITCTPSGARRVVCKARET